MRRILIVVGFLLSFAGFTPVASAAPSQQAASCQYVLGFATLHNLIPTIAGNCVTNESHATNGDGLQQTANGLMVWRKADNFTAFTDGFRTWINGPFGLQQRLNSQRFKWEKTSARVTSTNVINFVPPTTVSRQVSGSCFSSSLAATRSDAFRCMSGNAIFDPCFTVPNNTSAVICVQNPLDSSTFVQMNLTQPLPAPEPVPAERHAWFLQMADQTVCNFATGATGPVNGQRINYFCSDQWVIAGLPTTGQIWTAQQFLLAPNSLTPVDSATAQIATAWQ